MNDDWPIGFDDATLDREKRLRAAWSALLLSAERVGEVEYDQRKGGGRSFTASERVARLVALDEAATTWLGTRGQPMHNDMRGFSRRVRASVDLLSVRDELMTGRVPAGTGGRVVADPPDNLVDGYLFVLFDNGVACAVLPGEVTTDA